MRLRRRVSLNSKQLDELDDRILREFESGKNKCFRNILTGLLPSKMIPVMIR